MTTDFADYVRDVCPLLAGESLALPLGGRTYAVPTPSVERAITQILAAAVRGEINLGLTKGEMPGGLQAALDDMKPGEHPALGAVHDELIADGVPQAVIDRMAYYAIFFWARGRAYADWLARLMWAPADTDGDGDAGAPKG